MLNLYNNKSQKFECTVEISGNTVKNTECRLIFIPENDNKKIFFEGKIEKNKCWVDIPPLKEINSIGKLKLEIIVDDTLFSPWESTYEIKTPVSVESVEITSPSKTTVKIIEKIDLIKDDKNNKPSIEKNKLIKHDVSISNKKLIKKHINEFNSLSKDDKNLIKEFVNSMYIPKKSTLKWAKSMLVNVDSPLSKILMYLYEK